MLNDALAGVELMLLIIAAADGFLGGSQQNVVLFADMIDYVRVYTYG